MKDEACVRFLQWALPYLRLHWPGFRKVRKQVCKRIAGRMAELELTDIRAYRELCQDHDSEWEVLDRLCRITISRFCRDRNVFDRLGAEVLPALIRRAKKKGDKTVRCWSAGCASGEEAYTLALFWNFIVRDKFPGMDIRIVATDTDPVVLKRAERACYPPSSLKELPVSWLASAFGQRDGEYCLSDRIAQKAIFIVQDIRESAPDGLFHLVLCRNLAFTYFDMDLRRRVLERINHSLIRGGALVVGAHESLPTGIMDFSPWLGEAPIFRKDGG